MNLSKLATLGVISMSVIGLGMGMDAHAESVTPKDDGTDTHGTKKAASSDHGDTAKSKAEVQLVKDPNGDKDPTDPIHPGDKQDDKIPGSKLNPGTGHFGPMTIDYVSNLSFGKQNISAKEETYHLGEINNGTVMTQVSDNRATGEGWTLQVNLEDDFKDGENILKGAELSYPKGTVDSEKGSQATAPSTSNAVVVNKTANTVMAAKKGEGVGTWADTFAKDEVTLKVPGGNIAGNYSANIVWTLTDAPGA